MVSPLAPASSSSSSSQLPETVVIGVLALQGAFIEHIHYLQRLRPSSHILQPIAVRSPQELAACHALIIPGGESTVIASVAGRTPGLLEALQDFVRDPTKPVWGTCAGMILMAEQNGIGGGKIIKGKERQQGWGGIEGLKVWRNLYGTQLESFEAPLIIPGLSDPSRPFNAIFIRAPAIYSLPTSSSSSTSSSSHVESLSGPTGLPTPDPSRPASPSSSRPSGFSSPPLEVLAALPPELCPPPPPATQSWATPTPRISARSWSEKEGRW
ncbi:hypothetical protein EHS25_003693 [Saitozyma podzolica]|uniref:glutaminase n=1 Tax=Saitozyma podzolica TaxID=1890683 RepID=A0A427Y360_9TREE|nr:hypothetical protein EHS25_003693 [Saitozyma podzolica]